MDGVGDYTFSLAKELVQRGKDISVICAQKDSINTLHKQPFRVAPVVKDWNHAKTGRLLKKLIKANKPDLIIWQYVPHSFNPYGIPRKVPKWVKICSSHAPTFVFFHEVRIKINPRNYKSILLGIPMAWISRKVLKAAHATATSNPGYQQLLDPQKTRIIPVPSNFNLKPLAPLQKDQIKVKLGLEGKFIIGTFGQGVRGQQTLIHSFVDFARQKPQAHLHLIGGIRKEQKIEIENLAETLGLRSKITFSGYLSADEIRDHLGILDIYCMLEPSHSKTTWTGTSTRSGTFAAALQAGLPVIGVEGELNNKELKEVIILLPKLEQKLLTEALFSLEEDEARIRSQQEKSLKYAKEVLNWDQTTTQYLHWIEEHNIK